MEGHEQEIDAVGLVRRIRDDLYEETKDLSTQELIAFYRRRAAAAKERLAQLHIEREEMAKGPYDVRRSSSSAV